MTENPESALTRSIRSNMQLKDSEELLAIWNQNDRLEWSDETFSIIHDILLERLGKVPPQSPHDPTKRRKKKDTETPKIPLLVVMIFSPAIFALLLILLIPIINPGPEDKWFTILFFVAMALLFFVPGFYFGWKSFLQSKDTLNRIAGNVPTMKKSAGIFYRFSTLFLPDRFVPIYFLIMMGYLSIMCIYGGIRMVMVLIEVF